MAAHGEVTARNSYAPSRTHSRCNPDPCPSFGRAARTETTHTRSNHTPNRHIEHRFADARALAAKHKPGARATSRETFPTLQQRAPATRASGQKRHRGWPNTNPRPWVGRRQTPTYRLESLHLHSGGACVLARGSIYPLVRIPPPPTMKEPKHPVALHHASETLCSTSEGKSKRLQVLRASRCCP
jgi:hypothetical protein